MPALICDLPAHLSASFEAHSLFFRKPSGTSRGVLTEKKLWLLKIWSGDPAISGTGECSVIPGLSPDYTTAEAYEQELRKVAENPLYYLRDLWLLADKPSILFGLETAFLDWQSGGKQQLFDNSFTRGERAIPINGLIWMGSPEFMQEQIEEKIAGGFTCIKMKVGAIGFEQETALLAGIRKRLPKETMTLRVDANGAFSPENAAEKLKTLAELDIHSIEQPIAPGQYAAMKQLCQQAILPIALDEELIPVVSMQERRELLEHIRPQYIILKPSLHGGLTGCTEWIAIAESLVIPWWITSALESNIGLNAIAQFTGNFEPSIPQGLGTGGLYTTNFQSGLFIENGELNFRK